jgi:hypothetical protein
VRSFTGSIQLDFFPKGEQMQRQLQQEYEAALEAGTLTEFYDEHPEYEARLQAMRNWDDPEAMRRSFMISQLWDTYYAVDKLTSEQFREQVPEFSQFFLSSETRDYDQIDTGTMENWLMTLTGDKLPGSEAQALPVDLPSLDQTQVVNWYYETRDQMYPGIGATQAAYYALLDVNKSLAYQWRDDHPELAEGTPETGGYSYWEWNRAFKEQYPELADMMMNKDMEDLANELRISELPKPLQGSLATHFIADIPLTGAELASLEWEWEKRGKPTKKFEGWLALLRSAYIYPIDPIVY